MATARFPLGMTLITPGALSACVDLGLPPDLLFVRHVGGDWGDLCAEDRAQNEAAVLEGDRILSVFKFAATRFYVLTEADRSATTILLPEEY